MSFELLAPIFQDPRFANGDAVTKAKARQKLFTGYLMTDPAAADRYGTLPDDQQKQVVEEFYKRVDTQFADAFTIETAPAKTVKRKIGGESDEFGVRMPVQEFDEHVPAQRRPVRDLATEDFIAQVKKGEVTPDKFGRDELLATAPVILEAAPEKLPSWRARAKAVAVEAGVLPDDDTWQQSAARAIGTLGGAVGPAADLGGKLGDAAGFAPIEEGVFRALTRENRAMVALAYPDSDAFKTAGTLLALGGVSAGFGKGLVEAGVKALSKKGIALQAGADSLLGLAYRHEAPGVLASALGKPDDAALNALEAGTISAVFGVALRAIDAKVTLSSLREQSGFDGSMEEFRAFLVKQKERISPPADLAPNKVRRMSSEPIEEGAPVLESTPEEMRPLMPTTEAAAADLARVPALAAHPDLPALAEELGTKAAAVADKAAINGPALGRVQTWAKDPEVRALLQSDSPAEEIADALVRQEPGQALPIAIKDGDGVIGGSVPETLPSVPTGQSRELFDTSEHFNLASETQVDKEAATKAGFDRLEAAADQTKLFEAPPAPKLPNALRLQAESSRKVNAEILETGKWPNGKPLKASERAKIKQEIAAADELLKTETPPVVKPAASDAASSADSAAGKTGGRTGEAENVSPAPKVKGRGFKVGTAPDGEMDLLSHVEDLGGIGGPGKFAGGEYDGWAETLNKGPARLLRKRGGPGVDVLMQELEERGYKFASPDEFYSAIDKAASAREVTRKAIGTETYGAKFDAALMDNAGRQQNLRANKARTADELKVGDKFNVRGEPVRVTDINPDTGAVKIQDGVKRELAAGTPIYPDKGKITRAKQTTAAGDPFSVEKKTLPRRIFAPLIADDGAPVALASIREYLAKALDIPVRLGVGNHRAWGFFRTKPEVIRLKLLNDIPTLAHEVGHYLHKILFPTGYENGLRAYANLGKQFDGELMALGAATSRKSYSRKQVLMEGVAEFTREYLTDRAGALAKAPTFTRFMESHLEQGFPEIFKIVTTAREQLGKYINQAPQMKVRAAISRAPVDVKLTGKQRLEKFYSDWVSELRPIERTMETLVQHGLPAEEARQVSAAATNYIGGWRGKVEHDLFKAQTDLGGRKIGESLRDILKGLDLEQQVELGDYMVARRAIELNRRGIKSGLQNYDAAVTAKQYAPIYEKTRQRLLAFQHRNLQLLEQSGFFTTGQIARMQELNQNYVPFYRVYESVMSGGRPAGRGFVNTAGGVRRIKGSDRLIVDPLESIVKNTYVFRDLAERNMIGRKFIAAVESTNGGGRVADQVAKRIAGVPVPDAEIRTALKNAGVDEEIIDDMPDLTFTLWRAAKTEDPKRGIFKVWRGGREHFYQTDDQELVRSLLLMDSADAELVGRFPFLKSVLRPLTRFKRAGATLSLEFIARNPFRDQVQAAVYSKHGFIPGFDGFKGILSALGKDQYYWDWIKSGGRYSDFIAADRADLVKSLKNVTATPDVADFIKQAVNPINILSNLQKMSELMEMGTRIGEFRRAIRSGVAPVDAANASKDISLNFARAGFKGKVWNQIRAFFNASVQDVDKLVRAHREAPMRTAAKAFAYISLPSIGAWYLGKDDKDIQRLADWRKMLFWNLNASDVARAVGMDLKEPLIISLPKPFLLGHIYGTSIEKGLDYAHGRDPNGVGKWFAQLFDQSPVSPSMFVPDAGLPLIENATNYSFFKQGPIVSQSLQGLPSEFQATPATSQVGVLIGQATGTSPLKVDNLVRGYGAGLGRYATDSIDWFLLKTNLRDGPTPPTKMLRELPLLRGFVGSPYAASADLDRFYKGFDLAEKRLRAFTYFGKEISNPDEKRWWDKNRNELLYYDQKRGERSMMTELRKMRSNLSDISKAMVSVQTSSHMTGDAKQRTLLQLKAQRDTLAAAALKLLHPADQKAAR